MPRSTLQDVARELSLAESRFELRAHPPRSTADTLGQGREFIRGGEQARMVRRLTGDGDGVVAVVAGPGAGKTAFGLDAAREAWEASGIPVVGVPKTIDNDLLVTDHCPGFGSAAKFVASAFIGDDLDNRALPGVKINILMGRNAGFAVAVNRGIDAAAYPASPSGLPVKRGLPTSAP